MQDNLDNIEWSDFDITDDNTLDNRIITKRISICKACPSLKLNFCKECGCFMPVKVRMFNENITCPLEKW